MVGIVHRENPLATVERAMEVSHKQWSMWETPGEEDYSQFFFCLFSLIKGPFSLFSIYSATEYFAVVRHQLRREQMSAGPDADVPVQGVQGHPRRLVLPMSPVFQADVRGVKSPGRFAGPRCKQ